MACFVCIVIVAIACLEQFKTSAVCIEFASVFCCDVRHIHIAHKSVVVDDGLAVVCIDGLSVGVAVVEDEADDNGDCHTVGRCVSKACVIVEGEIAVHIHCAVVLAKEPAHLFIA